MVVKIDELFSLFAGVNLSSSMIKFDVARTVLSVFALAVFQNCSSVKKTATPMRSTFDWQGHRGCRGLLPENSLPAFIKALDFPQVRTLELDVVVSKDLKLVVSHEPWFNPEISTSPSGEPISEEEAMKKPFFQMDLAEIQLWDCGKRGHPRFPEQQPMAVFKPTLRQTVEAVRAARPDKNVFWNIEMKADERGYGTFTPFPEPFAELLLRELRALGIERHSTVQSFDPACLRAVKKIGTRAQLALLVENEDGLEKNIERLGFRPDVYSCDHVFVDEKLVAACHSKKMQLIPWTVNEVEQMRELRRLGVDGIITDHPDRIAEALKN